MISAEEVEATLKAAFPTAQIRVSDMTGTSDHYEIYIADGVFKGTLLIDQHRLVQKALDPLMSDGRLHAVRIKTEAPKIGPDKKSSDDFQLL